MLGLAGSRGEHRHLSCGGYELLGNSNDVFWVTRHTVGGNNIAGQKPYEFIGILIIMLKNHMNS